MEAGTLIGGRYELERLLGGGGIAEVYLAHDRVVGGPVALKILHPHLRDYAVVVDAFRREVVIGRLLEHPNVVRTYELGQDEGTGAVFLSMEYLPGGDLRARLFRGGPLDPAKLRKAGGEVLAALARAHAIGIVHRDLKPHNILLDGRGGCHLADFGLARCGALFGLAGGLRVAGTPEYMAPESVESGYADARSDLYSLGIVLYEAATGRLPFRAATPYELVRMHAEEPPPIPSALNPALPASLDDTLLRALEKDPSRRFQTAEEFAASLAKGETRALPTAATSHPCPSCGQPLADGFPYCFSCRREPLFLTPSQSPKAQRDRVLVTGPGRPGDQLGHELRHRCLGVLRDLSADTRRLERRLPRVPFVVLEDVDEEGASGLAERLRRAGLEAMVVKSSGPEARRAMRRLFGKKDLLMAGRLLGVIAASSGGAFSGLGRALARPEAIVPALAFLAVGLVAVPIVTVVRHRLPEVRWRERAGGRALRRYLELAPAIRSPALQELTRRVVLRLEALRRLELPGAERREMLEGAETLVLRAADWIESCQLLENRLEDEGGLYRRVQDLRRLPGDEGTVGRIAEAERSIDARRDLERSREILMDRLLAFSARLDRLWVALGSIGVQAARGDVRELGKAAEEAALVVRAVDEAQGGGS